jgi:hypothetical protein
VGLIHATSTDRTMTCVFKNSSIKNRNWFGFAKTRPWGRPKNSSWGLFPSCDPTPVLLWSHSPLVVTKVLLFISWKLYFITGSWFFFLLPRLRIEDFSDSCWFCRILTLSWSSFKKYQIRSLGGWHSSAIQCRSLRR